MVDYDPDMELCYVEMQFKKRTEGGWSLKMQSVWGNAFLTFRTGTFSISVRNVFFLVRNF